MWWRAVLVVAAALGLGKAGCNSNSITPVVEYGPAIIHDLSAADGQKGPLDGGADGGPDLR
jgi:hypothetical protein